MYTLTVTLMTDQEFDTLVRQAFPSKPTFSCVKEFRWEPGTDHLLHVKIPSGSSDELVQRWHKTLALEFHEWVTNVSTAITPLHVMEEMARARQMAYGHYIVSVSYGGLRSQR